MSRRIALAASCSGLEADSGGGAGTSIKIRRLTLSGSVRKGIGTFLPKDQKASKLRGHRQERGRVGHRRRQGRTGDSQLREAHHAAHKQGRSRDGRSDPHAEGTGFEAVRGPEGHDPLAFNFGGELEIGNRGRFEFIDVLCLIRGGAGTCSARQEYEIKPENAALMDFDQVILDQTNEPEYKRPPNNKFRVAGRFIQKHSLAPAQNGAGGILPD